MEIHERKSKTSLPLDWSAGGYSVAAKTPATARRGHQ